MMRAKSSLRQTVRQCISGLGHGFCRVRHLSSNAILIFFVDDQAVGALSSAQFGGWVRMHPAYAIRRSKQLCLLSSRRSEACVASKTFSWDAVLKSLQTTSSKKVHSP